MAKVSVIGAGNVGATCANAMLNMKFCSEIVLLDIKEGVSEGKALDMTQTANLYQFNTKITGVTNDYKATAKSDVVVITSGIPRKPGMTREELIGVNAGIVNGESGELVIAPGETVDVTYSLVGSTWKSKATGWEYTGKLTGLDDVRAIAYKIYANEGETVSGSVTISDFSLEF